MSVSLSSTHSSWVSGARGIHLATFHESIGVAWKTNGACWGWRARGRGRMGQGAKVGAALLCFPVVPHNCFIFYSRGNLDSYSKMLGGLWWLSFQENWQCPHQATLPLLSLGPLQSESTAQANATKFSLKAAARISMQLKARNTHSSWKSHNNYYQ